MTDLENFDPYHSFIAAAHAFRRKAEGEALAMGACYGVAAQPLPFQLATVNKILTDVRIRHLIADEVGLGKTIQAIMVLNSLSARNVEHTAIIVAPERLLGQWQEELWTRGHTLAHLIGSEDKKRMNSYKEFQADNNLIKPQDGELLHPSERFSEARVILLRPQDVMEQPEWLDPSHHDMLIIDEPQSLPRSSLRRLQTFCNSTLTESPTFRQLLILSATPRLGDPASRDLLLGFIEPERTGLAEISGQSAISFIDAQERASTKKLVGLGSEEINRDGTQFFGNFARTRRISRQTRKQWHEFFPRRQNSQVVFQPLASECQRLELIEHLFDNHARMMPSTQEGQPWVTVRALLRSRRSAREAIDRLDRAPDWAANVRQAAADDFGDSRLDALLDILAPLLSLVHETTASGQSNRTEKVVIVAGDAGTIDMLNIVLQRYFPQLREGGIAALKRTNERSESAFDDIQRMQDTLKPFTDGDAQILLLGDWIQAGLNLQHSARNIIFYSLPWDPQAIDQLIGRIDRLSHSSIQAAVKGKSRAGIIRIWQLVMSNSPEERLAEALGAIGVFDSPLPQISEEAWTEINRLFVKVISGNFEQSRTALKQLNKISASWSSHGFVSPLDHFDPLSTTRILRKSEQIGDISRVFALGSESDITPSVAIELANWDWLKAAKHSDGFQFSDHRRRGKQLANRFHSLWYKNRHATPPFYLPDMGNTDAAEDKKFFLLQRKEMTSPPSVEVPVSADGEVRKLLHFFDHGDPIHDQFLKGWLEFGKQNFSEIPEKEIVVQINDDHPACAYATRSIVVSLAASHGLLSPSKATPVEMQDALTSFTPSAQQTYIDHHIEGLQADWRWLSNYLPVQASVRAALWGGDDWEPLSPLDTTMLLRASPLVGMKSRVSSRMKSAEHQLKPVCTKQLQEMSSSFDQIRKKRLAALIPAAKRRLTLITTEAENGAKLYEHRAHMRGKAAGGIAAAQRGQVEMDLRRAALMRLIGRTRGDALKQLIAAQAKSSAPDALYAALRYVIVD